MKLIVASLVQFLKNIKANYYHFEQLNILKW